MPCRAGRGGAVPGLLVGPSVVAASLAAAAAGSPAHTPQPHAEAYQGEKKGKYLVPSGFYLTSPRMTHLPGPAARRPGDGAEHGRCDATGCDATLGEKVSRDELVVRHIPPPRTSE